MTNMQIALLLGGVLLVYLLVTTAVLQLATRMVAGFFPTLSSASATVLVSVMVTAIAVIVFAGFHLWDSIYRTPVLIIYSLIQTMVHAMLLRGEHRAEVNYREASFIVLIQVPLGFGVRFLVFFLLAMNSSTLDALMPRVTNGNEPPASSYQPRRREPRAGATAEPVRLLGRWGTLATAIAVPTKYGSVTYRAGSPVEIVRETGGGYVVKVNGAEFSVGREHVVLRP